MSGAFHARTVAPPSGRQMRVPFSRIVVSPEMTRAVLLALHTGSLTGGGARTGECHALLEALVPTARPFLTGSCTAALEMAALILRIGPGDEVIMPSWTFPSTANAFALRGAVPVFVDVEPATLNIDPAKVLDALSPRTKAVCCVHYAGVACDMEALLAVCRSHGVALVEDAAQAYGATLYGRPLGGIGDLGAFSFHGTKNVSSGEGGALLVNRPDLVPFAEIAWEKGTDRLRFERGETGGYEWQDLGSSFLPSDLTAALLAAQLREAEVLNGARRAAWSRYRDLIATTDLADALILPHVPAGCLDNGHIFAVRLKTPARRDAVLKRLVEDGIDARTHYKPLHRAPAGRRLGRVAGPMTMTDETAAALIRLPIDSSISEDEQQLVVRSLKRAVAAEA